MTQKSELTPENESHPVEYADIPSRETDSGISEEHKAIPDFFVEMFQEHGVAAIQREAPVIPKEWIEEYSKTDDFRYLCEAAAQCCRSFCDFLHKKLDSKEEK